MTEVELPDGSIAEFPDEMTPEQIQAVLQKQFAPPAPPAGGVARPAAVFSQAALEGAASVVDSILNTPNQIANLLKAAAGAPLVEYGTPGMREFALDNLGVSENYPFARKALEAVGGSQQEFRPQGLTEQRIATAGEFLGGAAASGGISPKTPALGIASALGAGAGAQTAREVAPGQPLVEAGLATIGGAAPYMVPRVQPGQMPSPTAVAGSLPEQIQPKDLPEAVSDIFTKQSPTKQKIAEQLKAGATDSNLAKYVLKGGKVATDKTATEAIRQGFDEGVISAVKGATPADRNSMLRMVETLKKGKQNALYAMSNRPGDIAGESLLKRVNYVKQANREAGAQLDGVAKSLKGKTADFQPAIDNFVDSLDAMGVRFTKNNQPIFKGSDIEGVQGAERIITQLVNRMKSGKTPDAYDMHRLKRYIDEQVTYGKSAEGLGGQAERVVKKLRADMDAQLDAAFPEYNKVNTQYADTISAIDDLQSVSGKKLDLFGPNADKSTGVLLRRLMSNAQSRVNLIDAIKSVEGTAKKYGAKFDDDVMAQVLFADELDTVFGPVARTSLRGETAKSAREAAEVATGGRGVTRAVIEKGAEKLEKARGISQEKAFEAIERLLRRNP